MAVSEMALSEDVVGATNARGLAMLGNCMLIARHKIYLLRGCGHGSDPGMSKSFFRTRGRGEKMYGDDGMAKL
jgi:hypothetical protein